MDDLLTPREVAALLGKGYRTVLHAIADGTLPSERVLTATGVRRSAALAWQPRKPGRPRKTPEPVQS